MKAISLKQPFANLIAGGQKSIETRTWYTSYRGDLIICSSKSGNIELRGYALCIVELYNVTKMRLEHEEKACCKIYPGAYSWFLTNVRTINPIFKVKGQLGLYDIELPENIKIGWQRKGDEILESGIGFLGTVDLP